MRIFVSGHHYGAPLPDVNGPWQDFFRELEGLGFHIAETIDLADAVVMNNHHPAAARSAAFRRMGPDRRILIAWESPEIRPGNFEPQVAAQYSRHIGFSPLWPRPFGANAAKWPQGQDLHSAAPLSEKGLSGRSDGPVMVMGNVMSARRGSTYLLRRQVATQLYPLLTTRGRGWPSTVRRDVGLALRSCASCIRSGEFPSLTFVARQLMSRPKYAGPPVTDKHTYLSRHKVSLVIENSLSYVSEKLFDAIVAGCVPVYVGPPLRDFGLDPRIAISAEPSVPDIHRALEEAKDMDVTTMAEAHERLMRAGLGSWNSVRVFKGLARSVGAHLQTE